MTSIEALRSLILELPPSCIEFWPLNPQYAVVGTYNLEKAAADTEESGTSVEKEEAAVQTNQQRNGSLILLQVIDDDVKIIQTLPTPSAILDVHFAPAKRSPSLLGVATSTGSFDLYQLSDADGSPLNDPLPPGIVPKLTHVRTYQYFPEDVLVTAFAWHPSGHVVGLSLSNGEILLASTLAREFAASIHTHDLEAWTLAFLPDGEGVYSGGDDSALMFRGLPSSLESDGDLEKSPWTDKKMHGAGVTAILPLTGEGEASLVITGSYDDHIRLVDAPVGGRRKVLAEMNLGGGVWRLKQLERQATSILLLVSCMHAGARIVKLTRNDDGEWSFAVVAKFEDHKSMNYGSDSQPQLTEKGQRTFISTSFYDRLLCLWRY